MDHNFLRWGSFGRSMSRYSDQVAPIVTVLVAASCVTPMPDDVWGNPQEQVGREIRVCGYMVDDANIVERRSTYGSDNRSGFNIAERGPIPFRFRGSLCVTGTVSYIGCRTGERLCSDWAFDYGISVRQWSPGRP